MNLECEFCNEEFHSVPIVLPCGTTICDLHLLNQQENEPLTQKNIICKCCGELYKSDFKYPVNKAIQNLLEKKKTNTQAGSLYDHVDKLMNECHAQRDELIEIVKVMYDRHLEKLNELKNRLRVNSSCSNGVSSVSSMGSADNYESIPVQLHQKSLQNGSNIILNQSNNNNNKNKNFITSK
jgi:hypothetical protein